MYTPTYTQITIVSFLPPTDTLGARIKLQDGTTGHTKVIPYNYALNNAEEGALAWLLENGIKPVGKASLGRNAGASILIHDKADSRKLFWLFVPAKNMTEYPELLA
jgi:hypothetical protein